MENPLNVDSKILPVEKYQIFTKKGFESLRVQLKGENTIYDIRLEKVPHLPKQLENQMLDQAAAVTEPIIQNNYMQR